MTIIHGTRWLRSLGLGVLLIPTSVTLYGCGGEKPTTVGTPEDQAATVERNKSMEEYMSSPAGKAATAAPK